MSVEVIEATEVSEPIVVLKSIIQMQESLYFDVLKKYKFEKTPEAVKDRDVTFNQIKGS